MKQVDGPVASPTGRRRDDRRAALRSGHLAERMCRWRLRLSGWHIIARNWRVPVGEIDIIARRGDQIAFVEVKARAAENMTEAVPSLRQRRRIARAAQMFLAKNQHLASCCARFDLMVVRRWPQGWLWPHWIRNAWQLTPD